MKIRKIYLISSAKIAANGEISIFSRLLEIRYIFVIINELVRVYGRQTKTSKRRKIQEEPTVVDFPVSEYQPTNYLLLPE